MANVAQKQQEEVSSEKKPARKDDATLLATARERFQQALTESSDNRRNYIEDARFSCSADQWTDEVRRQRGAYRPALTFNRLNGVIKQIIGDYRQNKLAIKVLPASGEASEEIADILAGIIRNIEAQSNADVAYANALECSARGGFGYFRIVNEYTGDDVFDQDLVIRPIHNPLTVYIDPSARLITREDANWAFITEMIAKEDFERLYPKAKMQGFDDPTMNDWASKDEVRIAEYYEKAHYEARLGAFSNGIVMEITDDKEIDALAQIGITLIRERAADRIKIIWRKLTGQEVLDTREYKWKYIPIIPVIGEEVNIEGKVYTRSAIYYAKDAQRELNYSKSSAIEITALATKAPWLVTPQHIEGFEDQWANANTTPQSYLPYNADGGSMPQRIEPATPPAAEMSMAAAASQDIQYTTGVFDASLGAPGQEVSGVAIGERQHQGATSTYIFVDNLKKAIEHCGRVLLDYIPTTYDAERVVRVLDLEGNPETETVNQQQYDPMTGVTQILNNITVGKYDVTIDTGPNFASRRREAQEAMLKIAQVWPGLMQIAPDLVIGSIDAPGMEAIAERAKRTLPPQITVDPESPEGQALKDKPPPVPPEVQAQQAQAQREQAEFQSKMQLEQQKFAFSKAQAERDFQLKQQQSLTDAALKEKEIAAKSEMDRRKTESDAALKTTHLAADHQHDMKKHAMKLSADQESSSRLAEASAKPSATVQINAEDAFSQVADTMRGMAEQQVVATQALAGVASTIQQQSAAMEQALIANTFAIAGGMNQSAEAMKEVAQAVAGQTAATEKQTEVMKAPRVAIRDAEGNITASEVRLK